MMLPHSDELMLDGLSVNCKQVDKLSPHRVSAMLGHPATRSSRRSTSSTTSRRRTCSAELREKWEMRGRRTRE